MGNFNSQQQETETFTETKLYTKLHSHWLQVYSDLTEFGSGEEGKDGDGHDSKTMTATSLDEETRRETIKVIATYHH